jgi:hypothetical protein
MSINYSPSEIFTISPYPMAFSERIDPAAVFAFNRPDWRLRSGAAAKMGTRMSLRQWNLASEREDV